MSPSSNVRSARVAAVTPTESIPAAAISGTHDFFDERPASRPGDNSTSILLPAPARVPDPAHRKRLATVVKLTLGVAVAIGALALVRVAADGLTGASDAEMPTATPSP